MMNEVLPSGNPLGHPLHGPNFNQVLKGTTTIGLVCKDGVVMATERRATAGSFIANKATIKLFRIDSNVGLTIAGLVGDAQSLARYLRASVSLYRLRRGSPISIEGASTLLANILNNNRYMPYYAWFILGGVDTEGGHLYSIDPLGGNIEDKYVSVGSGSTLAYGVLEENYEDDLTMNDGVDIALRSLHVAMRRDSASGDGYLLSTISDKEFKEFTDDEIKKRLSKLKIA